MKIRYVGYALDSTGYGQFARLMLAALHERHEISVVPLSDRTESSFRFVEGKLVEDLVARSFEPDVTVVNSLPHSFERYRGPNKSIGFTMCEKDRIPESWVVACNRMDGILVPTWSSKSAFVRSGVTVPVRIVHPGATLPALPSIALLSEPRPWTFLSCFEWTHPHKDPESLIKAYLSSFKKEDDVLLRVKTFCRGVDGEGRVIEDVKRWKSELGIANGPKIELTVGSLSEAELSDYYWRTDCYVSSHHGEGWGLPIWESMLRGIPAIATGYGGNLEFMSTSNSVLVPCVFQVGRWADIDVRELGNMMRSSFEQQALARSLGAEARRDMGRRFTPEQSADMFDNALEDIL